MKKFQMILVSSVLSILLLAGCSDDGGTEATKKPVKETTTVSEETTTVNDDTAGSDETTTVADETTSSEQSETTSEEVTEVETTTSTEPKTYEVKLPEVNPDWQTASAVTLDVPFVRMSDQLKGGGGTAIACATMIFNYYSTSVTQEEIMDEYIELMKGAEGDEYTFVDPKTTDSSAQQFELNILSTFMGDFYKNKLGNNLEVRYRAESTIGITDTKEVAKTYIIGWLREGRLVTTICNADLTPNTNAIVVLIIGFNNDNNTFLVADPTKDSIVEYNQDEFFTSMYSCGGNSQAGKIKFK